MTPKRPLSPRELTHLYFEACNERRFELFDLVFPADFLSHLRLGDVVGLPAFKALMAQFFEAFPDAWWTLEEEIYTADRAIIRYYFEATHMGPFLGIAPTGTKVRVDGCEVAHVRDGQLVEIWNYADLMGMAAQLRSPDPFANPL
jgi:predicted ester cyclase